MVGFSCVINTHLASAIVILSSTYCTYRTVLTIEKYVFFSLLVSLTIVQNIV